MLFKEAVTSVQHCSKQAIMTNQCTMLHSVLRQLTELSCTAGICLLGRHSTACIIISEECNGWWLWSAGWLGVSLQLSWHQALEGSIWPYPMRCNVDVNVDPTSILSLRIISLLKGQSSSAYAASMLTTGMVSAEPLLYMQHLLLHVPIATAAAKMLKADATCCIGTCNYPALVLAWWSVWQQPTQTASATDPPDRPCIPKGCLIPEQTGKASILPCFHIISCVDGGTACACNRLQ